MPFILVVCHLNAAIQEQLRVFLNNAFQINFGDGFVLGADCTFIRRC